MPRGQSIIWRYSLWNRKGKVGVFFGDAMGSKVTLKKFRTVEEKGNVVRAATCSMGTAAKLQRQTTFPC